MNGCTLRENILASSFLQPFLVGVNFLREELAPLEQILSLCIDSILAGFYCPGKLIASKKRCFPSKIWQKM